MITELSRAGWGAGPVVVGHPAPLAQFVGLVGHHTVIVMPDYDHDSMIAGDLDDAVTYMRQLQHARPDLGDEVPYSFVIFEGATANDCIVAEGRGLGRTGAHTIGYNSTRYGVAFAGDFTDHPPTPGMWEGVRFVGRQLTDPDNAQPTIEHRDVYATQCPGNATPSPALAQPPFHAVLIPPSVQPQETSMPASFIYNLDLDDFAVNDQGELVTRFFQQPGGWRRIVLGAGCVPHAVPEIVRGYKVNSDDPTVTPNRLDVFVDAVNGGRGHAWYVPGDPANWHFEILA